MLVPRKTLHHIFSSFVVWGLQRLWKQTRGLVYKAPLLHTACISYEEQPTSGAKTNSSSQPASVSLRMKLTILTAIFTLAVVLQQMESPMALSLTGQVCCQEDILSTAQRQRQQVKSAALCSWSGYSIIKCNYIHSEYILQKLLAIFIWLINTLQF